MQELSYSSIFNNEFLLTLSNWQNGWQENQERRREIGSKLVEQCSSLPSEFRVYNSPCYRKRFLIEGELKPILLDGEMFEGIASWTTDLDYAKKFKGFLKPNTKFAIVFKHTPLEDEIIVNIPALWQNAEFTNAVEKFKTESPENARALFNFKDYQSEIILKSTLRGNEIEDMVSISSSFDKLCDQLRIAEQDRNDLSKKYERNPDGIPIELPTFAGSKATQKAVRNTISQMKARLSLAEENNIPIIWGSNYLKEKEDL